MKLFSKLLGKRIRQETFTEDELADTVSLYDVNGKECRIDRSKYLKEVLPDVFRKYWNTPDELYNVIVASLRDGFIEQCLDPASRLKQIDSDQERSTNILGIVLTKFGRLNEAQELFENYLRKSGDSGVIMTNLAKVFADADQQDLALATLRKSLTVDPNQDNGLDWWGALHRDKDGEVGFYNAMEEIATVSGSWRPQLWLARRQLQEKKIDSALVIYRSVLPMANDDWNALMMISGDLGNGGYMIQMLDLLLPVYDPEKHGHAAGLNLIQASLQLGEREVGLKLCDSLDRLQRYDIKQYLDEVRIQLAAININ